MIGREAKSINLLGSNFRFTETLTDPATLRHERPQQYVGVSFPSDAATAFIKDVLPKPKITREEAMTDPGVTKDLLDAKLEAIEARMDARVADMSAKLDTTLAEIRADRGRFTQLESDLREVKGELKTFPDRMDGKLRESANDTKTQIASMKSNIWFGVATTIGAVVAAVALTFAAFDSGRETSKNISEAAVRMEKIEAQLKAVADAAASGKATPASR